jgi:hypothetical protein
MDLAAIVRNIDSEIDRRLERSRSPWTIYNSSCYRIAFVLSVTQFQAKWAAALKFVITTFAQARRAGRQVQVCEDLKITVRNARSDDDNRLASIQ